MQQKLTLLISSGLMTGYIPVASGTFATALAILIYWPTAKLNRFPSDGGNLWLYGVIVAAVIAVGTWASDVAEKIHGEKDPHKVVIDEIAGFFIAMILIPWEPMWVAGAFFLFRVFDVWKPWPIRQLQNIHGGVGIMIDDLLAGAWACVILHLIRFACFKFGWL